MSSDPTTAAHKSAQSYLNKVSSSNSPAATALSHASPGLAKYVSRLPESYLNSFSGAAAGVASGIVTCPLDVIKTKLQAQSAFRRRNPVAPGLARPSYQGLFGTASVIWKQDGVRGMYRGLGPMLIGYLPTWAVYMSVYGASRDYYYTKVESQFVAQIYASVTAGACSTIITNPIWVIKTRLMSQVGAAASKDSRTPWHYHSTLDAFRKMYTTEGIRSFYSGLGPALLGLTHVAIQFPLYETFKLQFTGVSMGDTNKKDNMSSTPGILAATFLSKVCATTATYPHEVLRTRLQTQQRRWQPHGAPTQANTLASAQAGSAKAVASDNMADTPRYRGLLNSCKVILREEGWRAFYYGMGTNLIRAVPAAMTTMLTFETLKRSLLKLQDEGRQLEENK
ncbi:hypothetical protein FH972_025868 [Carpinus fangiana]|uniref:Mitochondrial carrier protein n=1 Tax=Carpinus fangiana TaxID=176857 RepID=A0A5N6L2D1_9ROSI|nr:hypothetical protein FH972_025868 [Carpinus fangiana]